MISHTLLVLNNQYANIYLFVLRIFIDFPQQKYTDKFCNPILMWGSYRRGLYVFSLIEQIRDKVVGDI